MATGFIYVLSNVSMPGLVKIGRTNRTLEQRIVQLNTTGVPTPFVLEHSITTSDSVMVEKEIHAALAARGVRNTGNREFFKMDVSKAKQIVNAMASLYPEEEEDINDQPVDENMTARLNAAQSLLDMLTEFADNQESQKKNNEMLEKRLARAPRPPLGRYLEDNQVSYYEDEFKEIALLGWPLAYKELTKMFSTVYPSAEKWKLYAQAHLSYAKNNIDELNDLKESSGIEVPEILYQHLALTLSEYVTTVSKKNWLNGEDLKFLKPFIELIAEPEQDEAYAIFQALLITNDVRRSDVDLVIRS